MSIQTPHVQATTRVSASDFLEYAAFLAYAVLLALMARSHTFWRDEAEAWIIARNSQGWHALLQNVRYEGHPFGWYGVLYGITRFTANVEWMKVPNYLFSIASAAMILSARRVALPVRIGIVFSYFLFFEYAVIDRNYMLGIMLLLAGLTCMRYRRTWPCVPVMLSLAAFTSLPALVIAVCFYPLHLIMRDSSDGAEISLLASLRGGGYPRLAGLVLFCVCALAALAEIRPPADSGLMLDSQPKHALAVRIAVDPLMEIARAYLPMPMPRVAFWEVPVVFLMPRKFALLAALLLVAGSVMFFRNKACRTFFVATSVLLLAQLAVSRRTSYRHVGWLFVVFVLALLLDEVAWFREPDHQTSGWRGLLLYSVLSVQVMAGLFAFWIGTHHAFSGSRETARYLQAQGLDKGPLVIAPDFVGQAVLAYLQRPDAYYLEQHSPGNIIKWNTQEFYARHLPSRAELQGASTNGQNPTLLTEKELTEQQQLQLGVRECARFRGEIWGDLFVIYR